MAFRLADAIVYIMGDKGHLDKTLSSAKSAATSFGDAFNTGMARVGLGLAGVAVGVGALVGKMVSGNAQFEQYNTQFEVMLGSAEAAKQRMAELAEFGAKTPFELPQVVEADRILQGFGLHAEQTAEKFGYSGEEIRRIAGDVASGTGSSFQEMSLLIGKFSTGATGEAIARMMELGIASREKLSNLGLEFDKSGSLLSPLPEAMEVVLSLMDEKYGGMMDAQSQTFSGMMSNLSDWVDGAIRTMGAPIFDLAKEQLINLLGFLNSAGTQEAMKKMADGLAAGMAVVADVLGLVIYYIQAVGRGYPVVEAVGDFFYELGSDKSTITWAMDLTESMMSLFGLVRQGWNWLYGLIVQFVSWKDVLAAVAILVAAVVIPALWSFMAPFLAVGAAVLALTLLIATLRNAWEQDWLGIRTIVTDALDWIENKISIATGVIELLWQEHGDEVVFSFLTMWTKAQNIFNAAHSGLKIKTSAITGALKLLWQEHGDEVGFSIVTMWTRARNIFNTAHSGLKIIAQNFLEWLVYKWSTKGQDILYWISYWWNSMQLQWKNGVAVLGQIKEAFFNLMEGNWRAYGLNIVNINKLMWTMLENGFRFGVDTNKAIISNMINGIDMMLSQWDLYVKGKEMMQKWANGITEGIPLIINAIQIALEMAWAKVAAFISGEGETGGGSTNSGGGMDGGSGSKGKEKKNSPGAQMQTQMDSMRRQAGRRVSEAPQTPPMLAPAGVTYAIDLRGSTFYGMDDFEKKVRAVVDKIGQRANNRGRM